MHGIRTRQGAELRKRGAFSSAARKARSAAAKAGGEAARDIPHRPPLELIGLQQWGPFVLVPSAEGFEPAGCAPLQRPCAKNAKYEYCYLFGSSVFEVIKGKSDIRTTIDGPVKPIY